MSESTTVPTGTQRPKAAEAANLGAEVSLRLRIGITGHRNIAADHPGLATEIAKAAQYITQVLVTDPARLWSGSGAERPEDVVRTVVSSLAEGADRVVAGELLKRKGTQLEVVLPLPQNDYLTDFHSPESVEQFNNLIARAVRSAMVISSLTR